MMSSAAASGPASTAALWRWLAGALAWGLGAAASDALDGWISSGGLALPLVLAGALAAACWPAWATALGCVAATLWFNWSFVVPRGSLQVGQPQDVLLLATLLAVSLGVAWLAQRQAALQQRLRLQTAQALQLQRLAETLATCTTAAAATHALQEELQLNGVGRCVVSLLHADERLNALSPDHASDNERSGLALCASQAQALGPGTGRYDTQPALYLPLRAPGGCQGAVLLEWPPEATPDLPHTQALCRHLAGHLERLQMAHQAAAAHQQAQDHALRNTLLAAVAHDHRTPLASILSAATALRDEDARWSPAQRQELSARIANEATQLARVTDNALQLARLDAQPTSLQRDWQSLEELVGSVLTRQRQRTPGTRLRARVAPDLPLVRCDAVLVVQALENLVDNALKFSPPEEWVEILARREGDQLRLAVRDRGPGLPPSQRERVFQAFQRGEPGGPDSAPAQRGAGLGLALCRAVAQAHGWTLRHRARGHGGSAFEFWLPLEPAPAAPEAP